VDGGNVSAIIRLAEVFSRSAIDTTIGCDGAARHHTKRASTQCAAKQENARIESIVV